NKRQHELPMSPLVRTILQRAVGANAKANGGGKGKANANLNDAGVFGERGFSGCWDTHKQSLDRRVALPQPWRLHDLRLTAATMMAEMGVAPWIVEAILNHVSGHKAGVAGIYNRAKYIDDMRECLVKWANQLNAITA